MLESAPGLRNAKSLKFNPVFLECVLFFQTSPPCKGDILAIFLLFKRYLNIIVSINFYIIINQLEIKKYRKIKLKSINKSQLWTIFGGFYYLTHSQCLVFHWLFSLYLEVYHLLQPLSFDNNLIDYLYQNGYDWNTANTYSGLIAAGAVQIVIITFIIHQFSDDCRQVFSGRAYRRHKQRLAQQREINKQQASRLSNQIQNFKQKRVQSIKDGKYQQKWQDAPGIFGGKQKVQKHVIDTQQVQNMFIQKSVKILRFGKKRRVFKKLAEFSKQKKDELEKKND